MDNQEIQQETPQTNQNVFQKLGGAIKSIVTDWNKPSGNNEVPNKEIAAFSFGGH